MCDMGHGKQWQLSIAASVDYQDSITIIESFLLVFTPFLITFNLFLNDTNNFLKQQFKLTNIIIFNRIWLCLCASAVSVNEVLNIA